MNAPQVRTLVVTDLMDSTRLVEQLTDVEAATLIQQIDKLARRLLPEHSGREIDKTDGYLLLFERPIDGVRYCLALHSGLEAISAKTGHNLQMRAGVHVGEVVLWENAADDVARGAKPVELEGLAKPFTARLMSLAPGGRTLLSRAARDMVVRAARDLEISDHGKYVLKGVSEPVEVFEAAPAGTGPLPQPGETAKVQRVQRGPTRPRLVRWVAMAIGTAAAVALAVALVGWWTTRVTESMHARLVVADGGYAGDGEPLLTDLEQVRLIRSAGQVVEARFETARGHPSPRSFSTSYTIPGNLVHGPFEPWSGPPIAGLRQIWDPSGSRVERVDWLGAHGEVVVVEHWQPIDDRVRRYWTTPNGAPHPALHWDSAPFSERLTELDGDGDEVWRMDDNAALPEPIASRFLDEEGVSVQLFEDASGKAMALDGVARIETDHRTTRAFDPQGRPADLPSGCATNEVEVEGTRIRIRCRNLDGEVPLQTCPILERELGPDRLEERCLDTNGKPMTGPEGFSIEVTWLDERGHTEATTYLDAGGQPAVDRQGVHRRTYVRDVLGRESGEGPHTSPSGTAIPTDSSHFGFRVAFDHRSDMVSRTWVDADGEPMNGQFGPAIERRAYDAEHRPTEIRYFNAEGKPLVSHGTRHLERISWTQESPGPTEVSWFDAVDRPIAGYDGVHQRLWTWHANNTMSSVEGRDVDQDKIPLHIEPEGVQQMSVAERDVRPMLRIWCHGLRTTIEGEFLVTCLETDGRPRRHAHGWSTLAVRMIDGGQLRETRLLLPSGELADNRRGWARQEERIERGRLVEESRFDHRDEPVEGCARTRFRHDAWGRIIREDCFDREGRPTDSTRGCATVEVEWFRDITTRVVCLGPNGDPALHVRDPELRHAGLPFFVHTKEIDERGHATAWSYKAEDGSTYTERAEVDRLGRLVANTAWVDGERVHVRSAYPGTWRLERSYGEQGHLTEIRRLPKEGEELPPGTPPIERLFYDKHGLRISLERWSHDGTPTTVGEFPHRTRYRYNDQRRIYSRRGEDADGKPARLFGCYENLADYDREGGWSYYCLDADGELMEGENGRPAERRYALDSRRRTVSLSGWGPDKKPALLDSGVHEERTGWNDRNQAVARSTFDAMGLPAPSPGTPVAGVTYEYDALNEPSRRWYFGVDGEPVQFQGCWGTVLRVDIYSNEVPTECLTQRPK